MQVDLLLVELSSIMRSRVVIEVVHVILFVRLPELLVGTLICNATGIKCLVRHLVAFSSVVQILFSGAGDVDAEEKKPSGSSSRRHRQAMLLSIKWGLIVPLRTAMLLSINKGLDMPLILKPARDCSSLEYQKF